jgi:hypothetical protein
MYDIKYFFLNKISQTIHGGKNIFQKRQITKNIIEKHYFLKCVHHIRCRRVATEKLNAV